MKQVAKSSQSWTSSSCLSFALKTTAAIPSAVSFSPLLGVLFPTTVTSSCGQEVIGKDGLRLFKYFAMQIIESFSSSAAGGVAIARIILSFLRMQVR